MPPPRRPAARRARAPTGARPDPCAAGRRPAVVAVCLCFGLVLVTGLVAQAELAQLVLARCRMRPHGRCRCSGSILTGSFHAAYIAGRSRSGCAISARKEVAVVGKRTDGTLGGRNAAPPAVAGVAVTWLEDSVAGVCGFSCARSSGIPPGSRVIAFATIPLTSCGRCCPAFAQQVGELVHLISSCAASIEDLRAHRLEPREDRDFPSAISIERFTWVQAPSKLRHG